MNKWGLGRSHESSRELVQRNVCAPAAPAAPVQPATQRHKAALGVITLHYAPILSHSFIYSCRSRLSNSPRGFINFNNKSKYTRKHTWGNEGGAALLLFKEGIQLQKICWNMNIITSNRGDKNVQYRNKNQFSHNINLLFLPHKTSSQCHHSDCTFCSLPWIYDTWQTDLCCASERWVNPSAGACSIHCTPGYNIQIKLMQFPPF